MSRSVILAISLLLILLAALFFAPPPSRTALIERGAQNLFIGEPDGVPPLFAALDEVGLPEPPPRLVLAPVEVSGLTGADRDAAARACREWIERAVFQFNKEAVRIQWEDAAPPATDEDDVRLEVKVAFSERELVSESTFFASWLEGGELQNPPPSQPHFNPDRLSLFPPLLAIALAILFRRVLLSLFSGVWFAGAILTYQGRLPSPVTGELPPSGDIGVAALHGFARVFDHYLWGELLDNMRVETIGFVVFLCASVGVMSRSGGMAGMVRWVSRLAKGPRSTQFATYLMGLAIFFDDYANCILVGTTARPLTDRLRISREKLSFLVDATAAPIAAISVISTWIAFEVSTFSGQLPSVGIDAQEGYKVFFETIPFRYYAIFMLVFVFLGIMLQRDYGPMLRAERRARSTGLLVREGGRPMVSERMTGVSARDGVLPLARRAVLPILTVLTVTMAMIWLEGGGPLPWQGEGSLGERFGSWVDEIAAFDQDRVRNLLYDGSGTKTIMYGSFAGIVVASFLALGIGGRLGLIAGWLGSAKLTVHMAPLGLGFLQRVFEVDGPKNLATRVPEFLRDGAQHAVKFVAPHVPAAGADTPAPLTYFTFLTLFLVIGIPFGLMISALFGNEEREAGAGRLSAAEAMRAAIASTRALFFAVIILLLAWMIGSACADMGTANYLVAQVGDAIPSWSLPVILFLVSCLVAFATGSSWSTMGILLPIVVGLSFAIGEAAEPAFMSGRLLMVLSIGAVLEGSIFGDHCSPISDTTVLSSVSSASDHIDHVRTQMPYALTVMVVAVTCGYLPQATGAWHHVADPEYAPWLSLGAGTAVLIAILVLFGRSPGKVPPGELAASEGTPSPQRPRSSSAEVPPWIRNS